jgi:outer membrane protein TolC
LLEFDIANDKTYYELIKIAIDLKIDFLKLQQIQAKLQNSIREIKHYKQRYKAGEINITSLNNAILSKNSLLQSKLTLTNTINKLKLSLKKLTDKDINEITIPDFKPIPKDIYIQNNYDYLKKMKNIQVANYKHLTTIWRYLPKVSFSGSFGYQSYDNGILSAKYNNQNYYTYGLTISMPLDYNVFSTIEDSKINYLKAKISTQQAQIDIQNEYQDKINNIEFYRNKISLSLENIKIYNELISLTKDDIKGGFKLIDDLVTLQNSKLNEELNIKIDNLNITKIYANMYYNLKE